MLPEIEAVKGFKDFLPPESLKREEVKNIIRNNFKLYGFLPIETPSIELDELMRPDSLTHEDDVVSDRFKLKDRAGRNLGLRYEFTFQLSRLFKQNPDLKIPFKGYQIGQSFRDEPIGQGRFRQFTQCNADIIGDDSIDAEAECLVLASDILKDLKIQAEIEVNNVKLVQSLIESVEIPNYKQVMRELDKIDKIGEDIVKSNLLRLADSNRVLTLFKLLEKDIDFYLTNAFEGATELNALIEACKKQGIKLKLNPRMMRGVSYYTGNVFEIKDPENKSLAAGGRYDNLIGKFLQKKIPAVGISFGLERVTDLAKVKFESIKVILISINQDRETQKLAKTLRKSGISCINLSEKSVKPTEYAHHYKIPYIIFVTASEIEKEKYRLRDIKSNEEKILSEKQLIKLLS